MENERKTRIVCTLGPAVDSDEKVEQLLRAGMNVARFNFSHGTHEEQAQRLARLRRVSERTDIPVAAMMDTKGPEIRTGSIKGGGEIGLAIGDRIIITTEDIEGDADRLSISYKELPNEVEPGKHIFIADGLIDLEVEKVSGPDMHCVVRNGGSMGGRKNVNIPGVRVSLPAMTDKDRSDLLFGIEQGFDFVAASFVRKPDDVTEVEQLLTEHKCGIRIIAKIEDQEGLDRIEEIVGVSDGIMVARGDLGVQLRTEQIPLAQKRIISKCNEFDKPVITATQMLDSMIHNPNPTRAELTDVANAIFDGADAVMLSGETANGKYPVRSVETMHRIARTVESSDEYRQRCHKAYEKRRPTNDIGNAVARAAYVVAQEVEASAIVTPTLRGNTPRMLSGLRAMQRIIAVTTSKQSFRQLLLQWGVTPLLAEEVTDSDLMLQNALTLASRTGLIRKLDKVVTAAGVPVNSPIPLNTIKVHFMGNILNRGHRGFGGIRSGKLVKAETLDEAVAHLKRDGSEILITRHLERSFKHILPEIVGIIVEEHTALTPEEIRHENPDLVFIGEVPDTVRTLEPNQFVSIDGEEKIIYEGIVEA
jgi:pyruvate kinase